VLVVGSIRQSVKPPQNCCNLISRVKHKHNMFASVDIVDAVESLGMSIGIGGIHLVPTIRSAEAGVKTIYR
jgi:hypothetical protein